MILQTRNRTERDNLSSLVGIQHANTVQSKIAKNSSGACRSNRTIIDGVGVFLLCWATIKASCISKMSSLLFCANIHAISGGFEMV